MPVNPTWTDDELILVYALYLRNGRKSLSAQSHEVIALSAYLRSLPWHASKWQDDQFRSAGGIVLKIKQLKEYEEERKKFSRHLGAKALALKYRNHPERVHALAEALLASISAQVEIFPEAVVSDGQLFSKGHISLSVHKRVERNKQVVVKKLAQTKAITGKLACEVCDFDFEVTYGHLGHGFAECHHLLPLAEIGERDTKLSDLAIVCANCHRILHRRSRKDSLLTIPELRNHTNSD